MFEVVHGIIEFSKICEKFLREADKRKLSRKEFHRRKAW